MPARPRLSVRRQVAWLVAVAVSMFAFAYALVPLYTVFCQVTGLNGKLQDGRSRLPVGDQLDSSRQVVVQFTASVPSNVPWDFAPYTPKITVHPGEIRQVIFHAKNRGAQSVVAQAIPSISPGWAAQHFHKTECFCFSRQLLQAGESKELPLVFFLDKDLPADIHEVTLAYTIFDTRAPALAQAA